MKTRKMWKEFVLEILLGACLSGTLLAAGDAPPALSGDGMNGLEIWVEALTPTDVQYGEDVEFDVTVINTTEGWRKTWLWFTVKLEGEVHEKIIRDPFLDKGRSFHVSIPPQGEVAQRFRARPLDGTPVGFYTLAARIGSEVIPYDQEWIGVRESFSGNILSTETPTRCGFRSRQSRWVIEPVEVISEQALSFHEKDAEAVRETSHIIRNYPNPFNPSTSIMFEVKPVDGFQAPIRLSVYDIRGRKIRTLVDDSRTVGMHTVSWDGRDEQGMAVDSGIYLFRLRSGTETSLKKGILTK